MIWIPTTLTILLAVAQRWLTQTAMWISEAIIGFLYAGVASIELIDHNYGFAAIGVLLALAWFRFSMSRRSL